jgi:hypothetical protein
MSQCADEGTYCMNIHNSLIVHMHQKKIALRIAANIASENRP